MTASPALPADVAAQLAYQALVLDAALRHGVRRVVHCSTQGVHGIIRTGLGDEDSPVAPREPGLKCGQPL